MILRLSGTDVASGNGLQMQSREGSAVRGLVINNFPENGIVVNEPFASPFGDRRLIADCYIGTDPTGLKAAPNALRGIFVQLPAQRWRAALDIVGNVISGNARSGIFVTSGTDIRIAGNRIGAAAGDALLPLANGASGMYLGSVSAVQVNANVIAFNRDVGVGTDRTAATVGAEQNVMTGNGQLGIDHGLDDVTLNDSPTRPPALPQFPLLLSALWEEGNAVTRIEGLASPSGRFFNDRAIVDLYRNSAAPPSGFGEGEEWIGAVIPEPSTEARPFVLAVPRNLQGSFISATFTQSTAVPRWTSEFSAVIAVTPGAKKP